MHAPVTTIMANAMLVEGFKSSHPDLMACEEETLEAENAERRLLSSLSHNALQDNDSRMDDMGMPSNNINKDLSSSFLSPHPSPTRKKSVDFTLDETTPPDERTAKRSKQQTDLWTPKQVVDAISTCISEHERQEAISMARDAFEHDDQSIHNEEMAAGADAALAKHLTFLVYQALESNSHLEIDKSTLSELSMTCDAMESLYRASSEIVGASFRRMGSHVLKVLVKLVEEEIQRRIRVVVVPAVADSNKNVNDSNGGDAPAVEAEGRDAMEEEDSKENKEDAAIDVSAKGQSQSEPPNLPFETKPSIEESLDDQKQARDPPTTTSVTPTKTSPANTTTTQTIVRQGTFDGDNLLRKATKIVGHFARVGTNTRDLAHFPGLLGSLIRLVTFQPYDIVPWEARLSALWTIANLACNTDNMQMMVCTPGLVDALVLLSCRPLHPGDDLETIIELLRSRSIASRAILNLSWAPENKMMLAEHAGVIDLLAELSVHRTAPLTRSRTVRQILVTTRRHAVSALRNIAAAPRRTKLGLCHYRNGYLLDILTDAALNDTDASVKDSAFAAIHNLAIQDSALQIVQHPALVLALRGVLSSDQEQDASAKAHASGTLIVLERTITPEMESYEVLRDLLDAVNPMQSSSKDADTGGSASSENDGNDNDESEMECVNTTAV